MSRLLDSILIKVVDLASKVPADRPRGLVLMRRPRGINALQGRAANLSVQNHKISILIIDDEEFGRMHQLRNAGFNLTQLYDIDSIEQVQPHDIVLCDIMGVGKRFGSKFEGAFIVSEIRRKFPEKIVILYSGQQFDPAFNRYFQEADLSLKKDADLEKWLETLGWAVERVTDPVLQWKRIREYLVKRDVYLHTVLHLEEQYVDAILESREFPGKLDSTIGDDVKNVLHSVAGSAIFKLLGG